MAPAPAPDPAQSAYLPYTATSLSVVGRFIFMYLLYRNKSRNSLSLLFCVLSISSSALWLYYSTLHQDTPMITRSTLEILLLSISVLYIIRNKMQTTLPDPVNDIPPLGVPGAITL